MKFPNTFSYRLLVASQNGYMYIYSIPLDGGECSLLKKHGNFNNLIAIQ